MSRQYEEPKKTELRERCRIAADAAGYTVRDECVPIPFGEGSGLKGAILGDAQATAGDGTEHVYYVRPDTSKPLPQWLVNLATEARKKPRLKLYIVVEEVTVLFEKTCRAAGAGLLRITAGNTFELVVDPMDLDRAAVAEALRVRIKGLRRRLETKLELNLKQLEENFANVRRLTQGLDDARRERYETGLEELMERWRNWADGISARLDGATAEPAEETIAELGRVIEAGIKEDGDV